MKRTISIIFLLMIITLNSVVYASTLNLEVNSNKDKIEVGDEVVITVDWKEGMQAADFILNYDSKKFEFVNIDIEDNFYRVEDSIIKIVWVSLDDVDKTEINITFKAIKPGKGNFSTEISGGFANSEVEIPDAYTTGSTIVKVNGFTISYMIIIAIAVVLVAIILLAIIKKNRKK